MGSAESEFSWVSQFPCPGLWGSPFCASSPGQGSAVSPLPPFSSRGAKGRSCTCLCGSDLSVAGSSASAGSVRGCVFVYEHVIVLVWFDGCGCDSAGGLLGASVGVCLRFSEPVCRGGSPSACGAVWRWFVRSARVWMVRAPYCGAHQTLPCSPSSPPSSSRHLATEGLQSAGGLEDKAGVSVKEEWCLQGEGL